MSSPTAPSDGTAEPAEFVSRRTLVARRFVRNGLAVGALVVLADGERVSSWQLPSPPP